jgi:hypothetical protein
MTTLLKVGFVFAGMVVFFTESMTYASQGSSLVFWIAILLMFAAMVTIGCWDLSAAAANRCGWIFMIVAGGFCLYASLPRIDGFETLLKPAFSALYTVIGVLGFLKERGGDDAHAATH